MTQREYEPIVLEMPATYTHLELLEPCVRLLVKQISGLAEPDVVAYNLMLGVHEICTNITRHAYHNEPGGRLSVTMAYEAATRQIVIQIEDHGAPFDPSSVPPPNLEQGQAGGYGLFLVRQLFDDVSYCTEPGKNTWRLVKAL